MTDAPVPARPEPPSLAHYRHYTIAVLRRYFRFSLDVGRMPSLLGREFFRARVDSRRYNTFEDSVIFVVDVERCLDLLDDFARKLIGHIVLQEYTPEEAARLVRRTRRTVDRKLFEALDQLTEIFLAKGIFVLPLPPEKPCQAPLPTTFPANHCKQDE